MRGRLILAGVDIETLDFRDTIAAAEAVMFDPMLHGAMVSIDEMLDRFDDALKEADPETFGTSRQAEEGLKAAQEVFGQAKPRAPVEPVTDDTDAAT